MGLTFFILLPIVWTACVYCFPSDSPSKLPQIHRNFRAPGSEGLNWGHMRQPLPQSDARGMNRCVSMPVVFKATYQNIDLFLIPCVLFHLGRDIKSIPWFLCSYFLLHEYLFLVSIFGHTLCFSNESRKNCILIIFLALLLC